MKALMIPVSTGLLVVFLGVGFLAGCGSTEDPSTMAPEGQMQPADAQSPSRGPQLKPQETCPVMGGKINKDVFVDYQGKRVYFCCSGCDKTFRKSPARYLKKLADRGEVPIEVPKE